MFLEDLHLFRTILLAMVLDPETSGIMGIMAQNQLHMISNTMDLEIMVMMNLDLAPMDLVIMQIMDLGLTLTDPEIMRLTDPEIMRIIDLDQAKDPEIMRITDLDQAMDLGIMQTMNLDLAAKVQFQTAITLVIIWIMDQELAAMDLGIMLTMDLDLVTMTLGIMLIMGQGIMQILDLEIIQITGLDLPIIDLKSVTMDQVLLTMNLDLGTSVVTMDLVPEDTVTMKIMVLMDPLTLLGLVDR